MAKWKATSSEDKAKVIKEIVTNPDASLRDIEKTTWVDKDTVSNIKKNDAAEIADKSELIAKILDKDREIMDLQADLSLDKFRHLKWKAKDLSISEHKTLSEIAEKSTKRTSVFKEDWTKEENAVFTIEI